MLNALLDLMTHDFFQSPVMKIKIRQFTYQIYHLIQNECTWILN